MQVVYVYLFSEQQLHIIPKAGIRAGFCMISWFEDVIEGCYNSFESTQLANECNDFSSYPTIGVTVQSRKLMDSLGYQNPGGLRYVFELCSVTSFWVWHFIYKDPCYEGSTKSSKHTARHTVMFFSGICIQPQMVYDMAKILMPTLTTSHTTTFVYSMQHVDAVSRHEQNTGGKNGS